MSRTLEQAADLMLIGAAHRSAAGLVMGDIVDGVCRTAHCPVVVVISAGTGGRLNRSGADQRSLRQCA